MQGAVLTNVNFSEAVLDEADLSGAKLNGVTFQDSSIRGAKLKGASMRNVSLIRADIRGVDFEDVEIDERTALGILQNEYVTEKQQRQVLTAINYIDIRSFCGQLMAKPEIATSVMNMLAEIKRIEQDKNR